MVYSKIYCIKEKFVFASRRWFSLHLFNFQENFSTIFKMAFPITVMANFSLGGTFAKAVTIFTKLAFFNYVCSLKRCLTSVYWMFWNLVQINGLAWPMVWFSGKLKISLAAWPANITLGRVMKIMFCQRVIICATNNPIFY